MTVGSPQTSAKLCRLNEDIRQDGVPKLEVKGLEKSLNESNKTNNSGEKGTTTFTEKVRPTKGADGSTSKHLIESDSKGNTISKIHQVTNEEGKIIH